ncbi:NAD(P)/FAD-dependent oxidoreductase [Actinacidiphila yeochonensis]|uniref:NAD(P)/FAD-dependent oxidoreductase n=1 Tax=Actinacidiphila yeochonensis TaxID=89050 RepID=UPI00056A11DB|nr:FAD-dependent oxidoreductase [Actinacidiphila yeochonensis]
MPERRIAVVGSGVAGLSAAYVLSRARAVTLYEADGRLGGHAHTHEVTGPDGRRVRVDSGFIVHNTRTYPLMLRLFSELGVATQGSEMSLSVSCGGCGLEYAGARGPGGLFARPSSLLHGRHLRMLATVPVFHRAARAALASGRAERLTLGGFLAERRFPPYFTAHFVKPLVASVWSCSPETAMRYPAAYLFRFLIHHGLLSVTGSPHWRTVVGGSASYVERIGEHVDTVLASTPVRAVRRLPDGAEVTAADGTVRRYDGVVVAVHPDQALRMLADATPEERRLLGAFRYSRNEAVLHTDASVLPRAPRARASWNYAMPSCQAPADQVRVSYHLNRLQRLDTAGDYVVTLNAAGAVAPDRVLARMVYEHPVYTPESVAAQPGLRGLDTPVCAFAGAYRGWGFHEDGCRAGVEAAATLGVAW